MAISWEMYQRTGQALALGLVGLAIALPTILLALPAGYLADAFNRRKVIILSLLGTTTTSIALAGLSYIQGTISLMYGLLILDAAFSTLGNPARRALLPQIVPRNVFPNAVTWSNSIGNIASVLGPAIGGFLVMVYLPVPYLVSAVGTLVFIILLMKIDHYSIISQPEKRQPSFQMLFGGLHFLWTTRLLLMLMSLDMFAVLLGGAVYLLPIFAEDILQVGPQGFGWLRTAPAVGAFCTALLLAYLPPMKHAGRNLLLSVAGFGIATIIFGLSKSFWISLAMLFLTGVFDNVSMVIRHTLIQLLTPDSMRGRVSAVNNVFVSASNELGGLESGLIAHWFNPIISVVSGGIGTLVVVLFTAFSSPRLRTHGPLNETLPAKDNSSK